MESPSQFKQKIKELNQRYFLIIDEVVKTYPNYKIKKQKGNPTYFRMRRKGDNELNINKSIKSQFNLLRVGNNNSWPSFFYFQKKKYILKIFKDNSV